MNKAPNRLATLHGQNESTDVVPQKDNTAAIVVLYHPEGDLLARLALVRGQVDILIIVANDGVGQERLSMLDQHGMVYENNPVNRGLAAALNQGLRLAEQGGYRWALLLDQDTLVDTDLVVGLGIAYSACDFRSNVGIMGANYRSLDGKRTAYSEAGAFQLVPNVITSGSVVRLSLLSKVGYMFEPFFIEGIDIEYALRMRVAGYNVLATARPLMSHGAGVGESRKLLGRTVLVGHHPPWRCYLQYRNVTWIVIKYAGFDPRWALTTVIAFHKKMLLTLLFEDQRMAKTFAAIRGLTHGILGRLHKM